MTTNFKRLLRPPSGHAIRAARGEIINGYLWICAKLLIELCGEGEKLLVVLTLLRFVIMNKDSN